MSGRLYIKRGGADSTETEVTDMTGRKGAPFFDNSGTPTISMGRRFAEGEASQGTFLLVDPDAEIPSTSYRLSPHALVKWTEDATGDELWLARGRIARSDSGRRAVGIGDNEVEWLVYVDDNNMDLRGQAFTEAWDRPEETDIERILALNTYTLNGDSSTAPHSRRSCQIRVDVDHLVNDSAPFTMPAKVYPAGTQPQEVIQDCAESAAKLYGVVIHHNDTLTASHECLLYINELDHTTYQSPAKISDHLTNWDPDDPAAPVWLPIWDMGKATLIDSDGVISGLVSIWGGTDEDPDVVFVHNDADETPYEQWRDSFFDSESKTEAQATARANAILEWRRPQRKTHRVSVKIHASQHWMLCAGMSIQIKAAAVAGGPDLGTYVWRRIAELVWEPAPDGDLWAHMNLDKPVRKRVPGKGRGQPAATTPQPGDGIPTPPPVCDPVPAGAVETILSSSDSDDADWPGTAGTSGTCWSGQTHQTTGGSGGLTASIPVTVGETVFGRVNFREETGNNSWENVDSYNYRARLKLSGTGVASLYYTIVNQRYHNTGCIDVTHEITAVVPAGYTDANVELLSRLGGYRYRGWIGSLDLTDAVECPDDSLPSTVPNTPGCYYPCDTVDYLIQQAVDNAEIEEVSQRFRNNTGGELAEGDFVVPDLDTVDAVTLTSTASQTASPGGIILEGGSDQTDVLVGWFGSFTALNYGSETPVAGDYIYSSANPGEVTLDATLAEGAMGRIGYDGTDLIVYWWGTPKAGATTTVSDELTIQIIDPSGSTETIDGPAYDIHELHLDADCAVTFSGLTVSPSRWQVHIVGDGSHVASFPDVLWPGGTAPTFDGTADSHWLEFVCTDGLNVYGSFGGASGSSLIVREVAGTDIDPVSELEFDADDFVVTDQTGGVARVALTASASTIWRPVMAFDPGDSHFYVVVDGDGTAVMAEG